MRFLLLLISLLAAFIAPAVHAQPPGEGSLDSPRSHIRGKFDRQLRLADKDGDGALTKAEAQSHHLLGIVRHFERIDRNKDGKVTVKELKTIVRHST